MGLREEEAPPVVKHSAGPVVPKLNQDDPLVLVLLRLPYMLCLWITQYISYALCFPYYVIFALSSLVVHAPTFQSPSTARVAYILFFLPRWLIATTVGVLLPLGTLFGMGLGLYTLPSSWVLRALVGGPLAIGALALIVRGLRLLSARSRAGRGIPLLPRVNFALYYSHVWVAQVDVVAMLLALACVPFVVRVPALLRYHPARTSCEHGFVEYAATQLLISMADMLAIPLVALLWVTHWRWYRVTGKWTKHADSPLRRRKDVYVEALGLLLDMPFYALALPVLLTVYRMPNLYRQLCAHPLPSTRRLLCVKETLRLLWDVPFVLLGVFVLLTWRSPILLREGKLFLGDFYQLRQSALMHATFVFVDVPAILGGVLLVGTVYRVRATRTALRAAWEDVAVDNTVVHRIIAAQVGEMLKDAPHALLFLVLTCTWRLPFLWRAVLWHTHTADERRKCVLEQGRLALADIAALLVLPALLLTLWRLPALWRAVRTRGSKRVPTCVLEQALELLRDLPYTPCALLVAATLWRVPTLRRRWLQLASGAPASAKRGVLVSTAFDVLADVPHVVLLAPLLLTLWRVPTFVRMYRLVPSWRHALRFAVWMLVCDLPIVPFGVVTLVGVWRWPLVRKMCIVVNGEEKENEKEEAEEEGAEVTPSAPPMEKEEVEKEEAEEEGAEVTPSAPPMEKEEVEKEEAEEGAEVTPSAPPMEKEEVERMKKEEEEEKKKKEEEKKEQMERAVLEAAERTEACRTAALHHALCVASVVVVLDVLLALPFVVVSITPYRGGKLRKAIRDGDNEDGENAHVYSLAKAMRAHRALVRHTGEWVVDVLSIPFSVLLLLLVTRVGEVRREFKQPGARKRTIIIRAALSALFFDLPCMVFASMLFFTWRHGHLRRALATCTTWDDRNRAIVRTLDAFLTDIPFLLMLLASMWRIPFALRDMLRPQAEVRNAIVHHAKGMFFDLPYVPFAVVVAALAPWRLPSLRAYMWRQPSDALARKCVFRMASLAVLDVLCCGCAVLLTVVTPWRARGLVLIRRARAEAEAFAQVQASASAPAEEDGAEQESGVKKEEAQSDAGESDATPSAPPMEDAKEKSKEDAKEESKEGAKEESKEEPKEEFKQEPKEDTKHPALPPMILQWHRDVATSFVRGVMDVPFIPLFALTLLSPWRGPALVRMLWNGETNRSGVARAFGLVLNDVLCLVLTVLMMVVTPWRAYRVLHRDAAQTWHNATFTHAGQALLDIMHAPLLLVVTLLFHRAVFLWKQAQREGMSRSALRTHAYRAVTYDVTVLVLLVTLLPTHRGVMALRAVWKHMRGDGHVLGALCDVWALVANDLVKLAQVLFVAVVFFRLRSLTRRLWAVHKREQQMRIFASTVETEPTTKAEKKQEGEVEEELAPDEELVSFFDVAPEDVIMHIFSLLPPQDVLQCRLLNKDMCLLADDPSVWRRLYHARWPEDDVVPSAPDVVVDNDLEPHSYHIVPVGDDIDIDTTAVPDFKGMFRDRFVAERHTAALARVQHLRGGTTADEERGLEQVDIDVKKGSRWVISDEAGESVRLLPQWITMPFKVFTLLVLFPAHVCMRVQIEHTGDLHTLWSQAAQHLSRRNIGPLRDVGVRNLDMTGLAILAQVVCLFLHNVSLVLAPAHMALVWVCVLGAPLWRGRMQPGRLLDALRFAQGCVQLFIVVPYLLSSPVALWVFVYRSLALTWWQAILWTFVELAAYVGSVALVWRKAHEWLGDDFEPLRPYRAIGRVTARGIRRTVATIKAGVQWLHAHMERLFSKLLAVLTRAWNAAARAMRWLGRQLRAAATWVGAKLKSTARALLKMVKKVASVVAEVVTMVWTLYVRVLHGGTQWCWAHGKAGQVVHMGLTLVWICWPLVLAGMAPVDETLPLALVWVACIVVTMALLMAGWNVIRDAWGPPVDPLAPPVITLRTVECEAGETHGVDVIVTGTKPADAAGQPPVVEWASIESLKLYLDGSEFWLGLEAVLGSGVVSVFRATLHPFSLLAGKNRPVALTVRRYVAGHRTVELVLSMGSGEEGTRKIKTKVVVGSLKRLENAADPPIVFRVEYRTKDNERGVLMRLKLKPSLMREMIREGTCVELERAVE